MKPQVIPMLNVPDVRLSIEWYKRLGFRVQRTYEAAGVLDWAVMGFRGNRVMFNTGGEQRTTERRDADLYIHVDSITAVAARLPSSVAIVEGTHETGYGMRELIIRDLNGFWLTFGEEMVPRHSPRAPSPRDAFLTAATWHGDLDQARDILSRHPEIATDDIFVAAVLGEATTIGRLIAANRWQAISPGGALQWPPLLYLALSKYLRLEPARTAGLLASARLLLAAGADPNGGVLINGEMETPLYGAAGVAHHPEMTALLLEAGAEPNDDEVPYHSPENYDNRALAVVLGTGRITPSNLALMLVRKADWHDTEGMRLVLSHGASPNPQGDRGWQAMHHAILRDNDIEKVTMLLDHGGDVHLRAEGKPHSPLAVAARRGRADLLSLFEHRGIASSLQGVDRLIAACAHADRITITQLVAAEPGLLEELRADGGALLAEFASNGNSEGIGCLLDLGVLVDARYGGDGYFDIAPDSTALHVAAWRGWPVTLQHLIDCGATVNLTDGYGRTALELAQKACSESYWMDRCTPDLMDILRRAGAIA